MSVAGIALAVAATLFILGLVTLGGGLLLSGLTSSPRWRDCCDYMLGVALICMVAGGGLALVVILILIWAMVL